MKNTSLLIIGVVCVTVIAVACLYFGKDGAVIATILAAIGGAAGFGVSKIKEEVSPSDVQTPVTSNATESVASAITYLSVPVKTSYVSGTKEIDFDKIDSEVQGKIEKDGQSVTPGSIYAYLHIRAVSARVYSLGEVEQWNEHLMDAALAAVGWTLGKTTPVDYQEACYFADNYTVGACKGLSRPQKVIMGWANRLEGHRKALARLERVGLDWDKIAGSMKTAWMVAELAYNPVVQIGISSEDVEA